MRTIFRILWAAEALMENQRIKASEREIVDALMDLTAKELHDGRDIAFLRSQIAVRRRDGEPNWDANCGLSHPTIIAAFSRALSKLTKKFELAADR